MVRKQPSRRALGEVGNGSRRSGFDMRESPARLGWPWHARPEIFILAVDVQPTGDTSSESERESTQPAPPLHPVVNPTSKKAKAKRRAQDRARKQAAAADSDVNAVEAAEEPTSGSMLAPPSPPAVLEDTVPENGTEQNGVEKSPEAIIDAISTLSVASFSVISKVQADVMDLAPSTSASITSSEDDEDVETETGAEESAAESAAPTVKAPPTPRPSFSHPTVPATPSRHRSDDKKQVDHGKDHAQGKRWKNAMVRTVWSLVMIGGFIGALLQGASPIRSLHSEQIVFRSSSPRSRVHGHSGLCLSSRRLSGALSALLHHSSITLNRGPWSSHCLYHVVSHTLTSHWLRPRSRPPDRTDALSATVRLGLLPGTFSP
jgi:hypothetical protein